MNERIQKLSKKAFMLAHEANDIHEQEEGEELSQTQFSNVFNQKLIELTVRECIECTKEWRDAVRADSTRDYSRGYVHGCDDAIVEMKIRFGVE